MFYKRIPIALVLIVFLLGSVNMATAQILPYNKTQADKISEISDFGKCYTKLAVETEEKTQWLEVLCPQKVTLGFLNTVIHRLKKAGYEVGDTKNIEGDVYRLDDKSVKALHQFQEDHHLPIGQFDMETLSVLEVEFGC